MRSRSDSAIEARAHRAAEHVREAIPVLAAYADALGIRALGVDGRPLSLQELSARTGVAFGKLAQPLRVAIAGGPVSPPIDQTLAILDREDALRRIRAAESAIGAPPAGAAVGGGGGGSAFMPVSADWMPAWTR